MTVENYSPRNRPSGCVNSGVYVNTYVYQCDSKECENPTQLGTVGYMDDNWNNWHESKNNNGDPIPAGYYRYKVKNWSELEITFDLRLHAQFHEVKAWEGGKPEEA